MSINFWFVCIDIFIRVNEQWSQAVTGSSSEAQDVAADPGGVCRSPVRSLGMAQRCKLTDSSTWQKSLANTIYDIESIVHKIYYIVSKNLSAFSIVLGGLMKDDGLFFLNHLCLQILLLLLF